MVHLITLAYLYSLICALTDCQTYLTVSVDSCIDVYGFSVKESNQ